jgi:hypothetical protein
MFLLVLPHFLGALKSEAWLLPMRAAAFWEGTEDSKEGKAEAAKLPDAGISMKQCPGK